MESFFRKNIVIGAAEIICRLPLIFTVGYLARSIGTTNFGTWSLILAFQVFVVGVAGLGLSSSLSRLAPSSTATEAAAYLRFAFALCFMLILLVGLLSIALRAQIGEVLGIRSEFYWLLPMAVMTAAGSVADTLLDAFFKARMAVARQVNFILSRTMVEVIAVVLVFVFARSRLDGPLPMLAAYICMVVAGKLLFYPWLLSGMMHGDLLPVAEQRRAFLQYGLPMVPTLLAIWLVGQSDRLVLSHFITKSDLGVYAFAASLASYLAFLGYAVYPLFLPAASQLHDGGNRGAVRALFRDSQKLFMLLWTGAMTFIALWAGTIISWTGGEAFIGGRNTLVILCFAVGLDQLMGVYQYVFHLMKRTDLILWLNLLYAVMILASLAAAGFLSGIRLAPWAILASTLIFNVTRYRVALLYLPITMPGALIAQAVALAALTALLARYAAEWNVTLRLVITFAVVIPLAAFTLRRRIDPSLAALLATE